MGLQKIKVMAIALAILPMINTAAIGLVGEDLIATFEVIGAQGPTLGPLNGSVPGGYDALEWTNWFLPNANNLYAADGCAEICPESYFEAAASTGYPTSMSANYANSKVNFFSLKSFYAGCLNSANHTVGETTPTVISLPQPEACTIIARGYYFTSVTMPIEEPPQAITHFTYIPYILQSHIYTNYSTMALFTLPISFSALRTITFEAVQSGPSPQGLTYNNPTPQLFIDNVAYTIYNFTQPS